jgi:uncharacterized protein YlxW (UPF0749 family)
VARRVADTPLARAVADLVDSYGSDEKLAAAIGDGATRFTVMRWRVDGTVPEKQVYVDRLRALGVEPHLLERAAQDELASRRSLMQRVEQLEADRDDLTAALDAAGKSHAKLLRRVSALEKAAAAAAPAPGAQRAAGSSRRARSGR